MSKEGQEGSRGEGRGAEKRGKKRPAVCHSH